MCRYYFGDGRCANSKIDGDLCPDQENCDSFSRAKDPVENDCDTESWFGLYCAKYKRFFCPGKENCQTYEEYAQSFEIHLQSKNDSL